MAYQGLVTTEWYCAVAGERRGPLDEQTLQDMARRGELQPTDIVWRDGMAQWEPAQSVPGLFTPPSSQAPQPAPAGQVPQQQAPAAVQLQYATTPYGYFRQLGGSYSVAGAKWFGPVIASPEALYLLKRQRQNTGVAAGAAAGGLIGGLIAGAISAALDKPDATRTCTYTQIPDAIRGHPDWPVKKQKKDIDVLILPKEHVPSIRHPRFSNLLKLTAGGINYTIEYSLFTGKKTKNFLSAAGWPLEW